MTNKTLFSLAVLLLACSIGSAAPTVDCTQFVGADMSVKIQACTAVLNAQSSTYGVADARGFTGAQTWSVNPLAGTHPGGGVLLLGGAAITVNVPIVKPRNWTILGGPGQNAIPGQNGTTIQAAAGVFQPTYSTGTVTVNGVGNKTVTGSGTAWTSAMIGCDFAAGTAITAGTTSSWGVVSSVASGTSLSLAFNGNTSSSAGTAYAIYCPMIVMGDGIDGSNEQSGGVENIDLDCNNIAGCINVANYFGEEGTYLDHVGMRGSTNIAWDMEGPFWQNSGPFTNLGVGCGSSAGTGMLLAVLRGNTGSERTIAGGSSGCSRSTLVGIDLEAYGITLKDWHFEGFTTAIELGARTACPVACFIAGLDARNAHIENIWGAGTQANNNTLVDLSTVITNQSSVVVSNLGIASGSTYVNTMIDHANSCTLNTYLGLYALDRAGGIGYSTATNAGCFAATGNLLASLTTTAATTNTVTLTGMTSTGHCQLTPTNSSAASNIATTYVSAKTTNQITVTHVATAGMIYDISCTPK